MRGIGLGTCLSLMMLSCAAGAQTAVTTGMLDMWDGQIYYEVAGQGPAVVLIHGGQMDSRMWDDQFAVLVQRFRTIRYDVRGFGKSPDATRPYSDVEDLNRLLDHLSVAQASLVGLSLGGRIAIDYALSHPARVQALVLVGPGLSGYPWPAESMQQMWAIIEKARDQGYIQAAEAWLKHPYMVPAMENPTLALRIRQIALENGHAWLQNPYLERPLKPPAAERLAEIQAPTLILLGSRDVPDIQRIVERLGQGIPGVQKVVIEGSGHIVNMERPIEFEAAVLPFLEKVAR